jgi:hypothetical protein
MPPGTLSPRIVRGCFDPDKTIRALHLNHRARRPAGRGRRTVYCGYSTIVNISRRPESTSGVNFWYQAPNPGWDISLRISDS